MARKVKKHHHHRRPMKGRHLLTFGAAGLFGVSIYELWIRLEDFYAWIKGVSHLSTVRGTSFAEDMKIIFETPEMRQMGFKLIFLLITLVFAVICVFRRNHAKYGWALMVMDALVIGAGFWLGLYGFHPSNWAQLLKLVPLIMIPAGCIWNYIHRAELQRRIEERAERKQKQWEAEGWRV